MENFTNELKALLKKYDVGIAFSVDSCSDTHGLCDEKIVVYPNKGGKNIIEVDGYCMDSSDI